MNYTSAMDNGKIRCRVESNVGDEMMSVEKDLLLIPREYLTFNSGHIHSHYSDDRTVDL
jgi:hypothetical protein